MPNPFSDATTIQLDLPRPAHVRLQVYSVTGQLVRSLIDSDFPAGSRFVRWDGVGKSGKRVAPGVYLLKFDSGTQQATRRVVVLR